MHRECAILMFHCDRDERENVSMICVGEGRTIQKVSLEENMIPITVLKAVLGMTLVLAVRSPEVA